jgi:hypothetical protein
MTAATPVSHSAVGSDLEGAVPAFDEESELTQAEHASASLGGTGI